MVGDLGLRGEVEKDSGKTLYVGVAEELGSRTDIDEEGGWTVDVVEALPCTCLVGMERRAERARRARF